MAWILQLLTFLLNNCVHTDGDTAAATPRYERPLLCVRLLLRVAVAAAVGHRGASGSQEPAAAVPWTGRSSAGAWWSGRSARLLPRSTPPKEARSCKAHPPCPSRRLYPPPNPPIPREKAGPPRPIPSRVADPPAVGASSRANFRWAARRLEPAGSYCGRNLCSELVRVHEDRFDGDG